MKKLTVPKLVDFKRKSEISKKTFANNLKVDKEKIKTEGGGDYWISSVAAISNAYGEDDLQIIDDKISEIKGWVANTGHPGTKKMFQANVNVLFKYVDFDFKKWKPSKEMTFLKNSKSLLPVKGLEIEANPHHVFSFKKNDKEEVGAIWFIAKKDGLKEEELGMFADILNRYLKANFSKDYDLNSKYCIAVDVVKRDTVNYSQIEKGDVREILIPTIDELKKLL